MSTNYLVAGGGGMVAWIGVGSFQSWDAFVRGI
jgi:hypothetical protein